VGFRLLGKGEIVLGVGIVGRSLSHRLSQRFQPELSDRFQHPEAGLRAGIYPLGQAVLEQRSKLFGGLAESPPEAATAAAASSVHPPLLISAELHDPTVDRSHVWVLFVVRSANPCQIQPRRGRIAKK
jgi:hypothetical protein